MVPTAIPDAWCVSGTAWYTRALPISAPAEGSAVPKQSALNLKDP